MTKAVAFLIGLLLPTLAAAQEINVRSGEHGSFTRLVFTIPAGTSWELTPTANHLRLTLGLDAPRFQTDQVFDRINDDRISGFRPLRSETGLDILLNCQCTAEAFVLRRQMLVVDVRETDQLLPVQAPEEEIGLATSIAVPDAPLLVPGTDLTAQAEQGFSPEPIPVSPSVIQLGSLPIRPNSLPVEGEGLLPGFDFSASNESATTPVVGGSEEAAPDEPMDASDFSDALIANLARAASQGLLESAVDANTIMRNLRTEDRPHASEHDDATEEMAALEMQTAEALENALEALANGGPRDARVTVGGTGCVADEKLDLANWGSSEDTYQTLVEQRNDLYTELDTLDPKKAIKHAKLLIYMGFGAEARVVLNLFDDPDIPVLIGLSYLVDDSKDPEDRFKGQHACETSAAMWGLLAGEIVTGELLIDTDTIQRSFEELPTHMRDLLGERLADRLTRAGYEPAARGILRRLERMHGGTTPEIELRTAQVDLAEGRLDEADQTLLDLAASPGIESMDAVVSSIELGWRRGEAAPPHVAELAVAYHKEFGEGPMGPPFWHARIRQSLLEGRADEALDLYREPGGADPRRVRLAGEELIEGLIERADDVTFLTLAAQPDLPPEPLMRAERVLPMVDRLMSLGMADMALVRLDSLPENEQGDESKVRRARALLDLFRSEEVAPALVGVTGEQAQRLRAEALEQMGNFSAATEIYDTLGEEGSAEAAAWLSSDWDRLQNGEGTLAQAAALAATEAPLPTGSSATLGALEQLGSESAAARAALEALLAETRIDPE